MQIFVRLLDRSLRVLDVDPEMTINDVIQRLPSPMREANHQITKRTEGKQKVFLCKSSIRFDPEKSLKEQSITKETEIEMKVKYVQNKNE